MDRRNFLIKGCTACISALAIGSVLSSCAGTKYITGKVEKDGLILNKDDFKLKQKGNTAYSSFIIVQNDTLKYPICIYRFSETEYTALWMQCSHQGAELQASGDMLQCSAHGSEFTNKGIVRNGPAAKNLRTFPVTVTNDEVFIDLRKQS